jgi:hypothetical protein
MKFVMEIVLQGVIRNGILGEDDAGSKHFWNVGKLLSDYAAQQPRRLSSSYSNISIVSCCRVFTWEKKYTTTLHYTQFGQLSTPRYTTIRLFFLCSTMSTV